METVMNVLHVATAVFIVGPMAILPHFAPRMVRDGRGGELVSLSKTTTLVSWLSLLVVLFGFGVMGMSTYGTSFSDTWIWLSVVLYLVALLLSLLLVVPAMRKAGGAGDAGAAVEGGAKPSAGPIAGGAGIATICLIIVVILMVWKP